MLILLVDDHKDVRSALGLKLNRLLPGTRLIEAATIAEAIQAALRGCPDLALIDWELPDLRPDPAQALRQLCQACPRLVVGVLSSDPEAARPALAAGANGFLCKADPPEQFQQQLGELIMMASEPIEQD